MDKAIYVELFKTFAKPRTYIGLATIVLLIGLIQLGFYFNKDDIGGRVRHMLGDNVSVENLGLNGYAVCYFVLQMLYVHLPIIVALVSGDSISGEMNSGTIRSLLVKPLPRWKIFIAKFIANQIYLLAVVFVIFLFGFILSLMLFGSGDIVVFGEETSILSKESLLSKFLYAIGLSYFSLSVISNLAFLFSSYLENSIAPIVLTMVINIAFLIFGSLTFEMFAPIQKLLFTEHMSLWRYCFDIEPNQAKINHSLFILGIYIVSFLSLAFFRFTHKDITQ